MKNIAIIVAGGQGRRMGQPKQFLKINGKPMLEWTVAAYQACLLIDGIILVIAPDQFKAARKIKAKKIINIVAGGRERQDSVWNGLDLLPESCEIVAIHDGARPAVTKEIIDKSIREAKQHGAAIVAVPIKDTIKMTNDEDEMKNASHRESVISSARGGKLKIKNEGVTIKKTVDRKSLWAAQTPQTFRVGIIRQAYVRLKGKATDDAMAVEKLGLPVRIVVGSYDNIKVTTPADLVMMGAILKKRRS
jgi:2-C-methyl-D-erythritol 4-phosphate cytidylyltransferase